MLYCFIYFYPLLTLYLPHFALNKDTGVYLVYVGNGCNVEERYWGSVVDTCNCTDDYITPECELNFNSDSFICKSNVSTACYSAVENWALAYSTSSNANDLECKDQDPNFKASQNTWKACSEDHALQG